jgi:hypothetical protein
MLVGKDWEQCTLPVLATSEHRMNSTGAVAFLHSFEFSNAIARFDTALRNDATCGIAYWGIALSQWSNPFALGLKDQSQLQTGRATAELGGRTGAKTERERDYIAAVAALYTNTENTSQRGRLIAYRDRMEAVAAKYQTDHEAQFFMPWQSLHPKTQRTKRMLAG